MKRAIATQPFPITSYKKALRVAWMEVFDDAPILVDIPIPLCTGSVADESFILGVRIVQWNLGLAHYRAGWVVGQVSPTNEFIGATPPMETVEAGIAALLGMVANTKACHVLFQMDIRDAGDW
jgi:hypothetical protein